MTHSENSTEIYDINFFDEMKDVKPILQDTNVFAAKPSNTLAQQLKREAIEKEHSHLNNYLSVEKVEPVDPLDYLSFKKSGVQEGVFKSLRQGKYKIDQVINLQQQKLDQARSIVFNSVANAHKKDVRTILIKHGTGQHSKPFPAFMKSYVKQWLLQMPEVLAFHTAQKHHGGLASVYVLLKKSNEARIANRELHRRKQAL